MSKRLHGKLMNVARREDFLTGCIAAAAILIFAGSAGKTLWPSLAYLLNVGGGADRVAGMALLLNIALLVFALARHRDARRAMEQRLAAEERAHRLRTRDLQTELLNRSAFKEKGDLLIERARGEGGNVALILVNLDRFKRINEINGDEVGDALLRIIATLLLNLVPQHALCCRLGSDEFAVLLPFDQTNENKLSALIDEVLKQLNLPIDCDGVTLKVSASIGVATLGYGCTEFSTLLRRAEIAMNAAKAGGRGRARWFDAKMAEALRTENEVELGLRRGIPAGEFVPYYQPIVEFASGRIRGFEMLAR
jgi:diguanylate cyclase (GGDEF)-like protein